MKWCEILYLFREEKGELQMKKVIVCVPDKMKELLLDATIKGYEKRGWVLKKSTSIGWVDEIITDIEVEDT